MYYYVYRITCHHPDSIPKHYYGFRGAVNPHQDEYWSSSTYVRDAIQKYGKEWFSKKILNVYDTRESAIDKEIALHTRFDVDRNEWFFNKCKQSKWGYNCTGTVMKGKTYEQVMGADKASRLRARRSATMKRIRKSDPLIGKRNPNYGNRWSDDQKRALSEQRTGSKHPTFGWKWITDGQTARKIPPVEPIPDGWRRGRK